MNITILGAGFAALTAVKEVRKQAPQAVITLVSPVAELVYLPSLIWIPAGLRQGSDLRIPLTNFFRRKRVQHVAAQVTGISDDGRTVYTNAGELHNDGLIIATGGRFIKKLPGIEQVITPCEGIAAGEAIRDRLAAMTGGTVAIGFAGNPNEPSAMRGGPMFEFLFGIDTLLRRQGRRQQFELVFFNPALRPAQRLGETVPEAMLSMMAQRNIRTHLGHKITGFEANRVLTEGGDIAADLILFMPGITGPVWAAECAALPKSPGGLIQADAHCQVAGMAAVYVAGDSGSYPGPDWQAKQAHMADLQAVTAARNLLAELQGKPAQQTFKHELVCIVDTLSHGMLIKRTGEQSLMLPPLRLMHYAKRFFEFWYLRRYR